MPVFTEGEYIMMHEFYDPANLQKIKVAIPLLYSRLEKLLTGIHKCWLVLISDPAPSNETRILYLLDLMDLMDDFSKICKSLRVEYHMRTGRQFFKRINNFNQRRTMLRIALAMYDDLTSQ